MAVGYRCDSGPDNEKLPATEAALFGLMLNKAFRFTLLRWIG